MRTADTSFPIGVDESDAWLACMKAALDETELDGQVREALRAAFARTARMLRNRG